MAASYEYPNKTACNRAISWSPDNRICFCTDTAIKVLSLNCGIDNTETKVKCHQTSFPVNPDIFDIPQFSVNEHKFLLKNLSREDLKILNIERVLNPWKYQSETIPRTGYAAVDWSPLGADDVGRSILATLSQDYRLCIYTHKPSQNEWCLMCDLSVLRRSQTKPELVVESITDYNTYTHWCYSQAVSVMRWCPSVFTESDNGQKYMLLATGSKSGHLVMWKVNLQGDNKLDCRVLYTVQPHECQVSGLLWSQQSDLLTASFIDGQIYAINTNTEDVTQEPTCFSVYSESDLMKCSSMCLLENVKTDVYVLLVNKEHCVLALLLNKDSHTLISQSHIFLENVQPASGMCVVTSNTVLMMSHDAMLQKITVTIDNNDMKLVSEVVTLDFGGNTVLVSHGFCMSPNKVLTAFISRPMPGFDHLAPNIKKSATKVHFRCLDDFNIGTHCRDESSAKITESPGASGSMLDVLELYRQVVVNKNYTLTDSGDECQKTSFRKLKLKRYGTMLRYRIVKQKAEDEIAEQNLKKETEDLLRMIIAKYIKLSVEKIKEVKVTSEPTTDHDLAVVSGMHSWLEKNSDCLGDVEDESGTKQYAAEILSQSGKEHCIQCCVCSNKIQLKDAQWQCDSGHAFDTCSKTLLPVEGVNYTTCTVCFSHARPPELLKDLQWLNQDSDRCSFCDGMMLP